MVDGVGQAAAIRDGKTGDFAEGKVTKQRGIVRLSEFDQKLGHTRIHHSLIVQNSVDGLSARMKPSLAYLENTQSYKETES